MQRVRKRFYKTLRTRVIRQPIVPLVEDRRLIYLSATSCSQVCPANLAPERCQSLGWPPELMERSSLQVLGSFPKTLCQLPTSLVLDKKN